VYKKAAILAAGVIILTAAIIFYRVDHRLDDMEIDTDNIIVPEQSDTPYTPVEPLSQTTPQEEEESQDFYTLIIGLDLRGTDFMLNTDSLIVAHVIPQTHTVKMMSIPRDQKVTNRQGENTKINGVFAEGYQSAVREARKKPELLSGRRVNLGKYKIHEEYISSGISALRESVERHLGVKIKYSYLINFDTVVELVDAVGGIEINVDRSMRYENKSDGTNIRLDKGLQILDGQNALNYSRHREDDRGPNYESSDFDRGRRQQEVISAMVKKIASWNSLGKAMDLLDIVTTNVKTDMKRTKMISLVRDFYGQTSSETIVSIPYPGVWKYPYVQVKEEEWKQALEQFKAIDPAESGSPVDKEAAGPVSDGKQAASGM
jgi:polyisoprenyl-teichoic acid--peptidoglycan teichoic acid transferase